MDYMQRMEKEMRGEHFRQMDPRAVEWLHKLIQETDAKLVLSSTWRKLYTLTEMESFFEKVYPGFCGEFIGATPDLCFGKYGDCITRGSEILAWIKEHPVECGAPYYDYKRYVIFDDDSDMLLGQKDNFINTDGFFGLSMMDTYKAKQILGFERKIYEPPY